MPSIRARVANCVAGAFFKGTFDEDYSVERLRLLTGRMDRLAPRPPRGTRIEDRDFGEFTAAWISTRRSTAGRVILHLPGGGFASRTPAMHRWVVGRICRE